MNQKELQVTLAEAEISGIVFTAGELADAHLGTREEELVSKMGEAIAGAVALGAFSPAKTIEKI